MQNNSEDTIDPNAPPSKTQRKQEMHALQDIGEQLVEFEIKQLNELDIPETLMDAIFLAKQTKKHGARRRQLQYIGKLMRNVEVAPIQEKINAWKNVSLQNKARLHLIENWRIRLLADDDSFTEFGNQYPRAEMQQLRLLTRNAHKEKAASKPPKSFRLIFQVLQEIIPETPESTENDH